MKYTCNIFEDLPSRLISFRLVCLAWSALISSASLSWEGRFLGGMCAHFMYIFKGIDAPDFKFKLFNIVHNNLLWYFTEWELPNRLL